MSVLPNLLIIGAPKCATTSIASLLEQGGASIGRSKEPGILTSSGMTWPQAVRLYRHHFENRTAGSLRRVDATPWTLYSRTGLTLVDRLDQEVGRGLQIVVSLRDPINRAISMHADQVRRGRERRSVSDALEDSMNDYLGMATQSVRPTDYVAASTYSKYLEPWIRRFASTDQIRVLSFEQLTNSDSALDSLGQWTRVPLSELDHLNSSATPGNSLDPFMDKVVELGQHLPRQLRTMLRRPGLAALPVFRSMGRETKVDSGARAEVQLSGRFLEWWHQERRDLESLTDRYDMEIDTESWNPEFEFPDQNESEATNE